MSVSVSRRFGVRVAVARAAAHHDPLADLCSMLPALLEKGERLVVDLSAVTLTPRRRVAGFMKTLAERRAESGSEVVVVVGRLTARRLLRALSTDDSIAVVHSLPAALVQSRARRRAVRQGPEPAPGRVPRQRGHGQQGRTRAASQPARLPLGRRS